MQQTQGEILLNCLYLWIMAMHDPVKYESGTYVGPKIKERSFGHISTSETAIPENFSSEWHYHANPHFSHILSGGSKEVRKDGSAYQPAGTGLYYYPGIPHQNIDYRPGTRIFNIEFELSFFEQYGLSLPAESLMFDSNVPCNTSGLIRIMKEHYINDPESVIAIDQLCINLVQSALPAGKQYPEWTKKIRTVLHDNWNTPLTLIQLAEILDLHPVTISRYFSAYFNCTLGEYIRRIKTEHALALIRANKHTLTEIAYLCGFADQAHFTRTFQHITGLLPKQYKGL